LDGIFARSREEPRPMNQKAGEGTIAGILAAGAMILMLALSGCTGEVGEAEAQTFIEIQTFSIVPETFFLRPDAKPDIEIIDMANIYTITAETVIKFQKTGDSGLTTLPLLLPGDIVVERPDSGKLTLMRFSL